jgi:hypothetical protein
MRGISRSFLIALLGVAACAPAPKKEAALPKPETLASSAVGHSPAPVNGPGHLGIYLFHGYRCGTDCLLHQQGYQWAAKHAVTDAHACHGTSEEFIEGCLAFAGVEGPLGERDFDVSFPHMSGAY